MPGQPYPGQPVPGEPFPAAAEFGQPGFGPPGYPPPPGYPAPPKKKRGLLIASIVLAVTLVLCGGGGLAAFLLLSNAETGDGAAEPTAAVDTFLKAVYIDKDAKKAIALVCAEARKEADITKKVDEVKKYSTTYKGPRFAWNAPKVDEQNEERAIVSVQLTMTTGDEKTADQHLKFTVVQKTGWWVCEVA
jgi:flagellar basal body-associated protein FliL